MVKEIKKMNNNSSLELADEIIKFIKLLRTIYKDLNTDIYESLGKPFQKSVHGLVRLIPNDWSDGSLKCYKMLKGMAGCVQFDKLAKVLHNNCAVAWGKVNSKEFVFDCMKGYCTISIEYEKAAENILSNFNPIFKAIDYIFGHEILFIDRLSKIYKMINADDPLVNL